MYSKVVIVLIYILHILFTKVWWFIGLSIIIAAITIVHVAHFGTALLYNIQQYCQYYLLSIVIGFCIYPVLAK